ncbi:MAG: metallophosphoesterase [Planctomycetota bacterium]|jgi:putative phosphoesterase
MKIGIIADTHDHVRNVGKALDQFTARGVEVVLHAGDVVAPFAAKALARFAGPLHAVFGNNDGERAGLSKVLDISRPPRDLTLGGRKVVLAHDPVEIPGELAGSAEVIVTGHTHEPEIAPGRPVRINPGEAGGWLTGRATCVVLDTETLEADVIELGGT